MKNVLRRSGALVASALLVAGLAACGGNGNGNGGGGIGSALLDEMVADCVAEAPGQEAFCRCAIRVLADEFSLEQLENMSDAEIAQHSMAASMECLDEMDLDALLGG